MTWRIKFLKALLVDSRVANEPSLRSLRRPRPEQRLPDPRTEAPLLYLRDVPMLTDSSSTPVALQWGVSLSQTFWRTSVFTRLFGSGRFE